MSIPQGCLSPLFPKKNLFLLSPELSLLLVFIKKLVRIFLTLKISTRYCPRPGSIKKLFKLKFEADNENILKKE
jgi:hypothetical protein